jgi:hypothetical protein
MDGARRFGVPADCRFDEPSKESPGGRREEDDMTGGIRGMRPDQAVPASKEIRH